MKAWLNILATMPALLEVVAVLSAALTQLHSYLCSWASLAYCLSASSGRLAIRFMNSAAF